MTGIMCRPRNSAFLSFGYTRQRRRFSFTSRFPTVICVGRRLSMETGSRTGGGLITISFSCLQRDQPYETHIELQRLNATIGTKMWVIESQGNQLSKGFSSATSTAVFVVSRR